MYCVLPPPVYLPPCPPFGYLCMGHAVLQSKSRNPEYVTNKSACVIYLAGHYVVSSVISGRGCIRQIMLYDVIFAFEFY